MVLISHLPLVNASIPGGMTIFLSTVAKILRFGFIPYDKWIATASDVVISNSSYSYIFEQNGYGSTSIVLNLAALIALFVLTSWCIIFAKCMDCSYLKSEKKPVPNGREMARNLTYSQLALNCFFRLVMLTLLEFFICILINLKAVSNALIFIISITFMSLRKLTQATAFGRHLRSFRLPSSALWHFLLACSSFYS